MLPRGGGGGREIFRQTDRQTVHVQTDVYKQTDKHVQTDRDRQTHRHVQTDRQTDRQLVSAVH